MAGNGTAGFGGDFGLSTAAMLREPTDLALDSLSNLYVADYGNNRIRMVAFSRSIISTVAGTGSAVYDGEHVSATSAALLSPQHVAADASGNLYIADGNRIRKITRGVIATVAGGGTPAGENGPAASAQLLAPQAVAVDPAGNVYITDPGTGRILKVAGDTLTRVSGALPSPNGIAASTTGDLFITDTQKLTLSKISNGALTTVAGGGAALGDAGPPAKAQLKNPVAVAVDTAGSLYLADLNRIRMVANNVISTVAGNGSAGYQGDGAIATAAEISNPTSVAVDNLGNFYFADYGNNRVRMVSNGNVTTVAGNGTYGVSGSNGSATSAQIGSPAGVAADSAGNLYITDSYRLLQVVKGKVYTLAGLQNPQGIALDAAGNIYIAEPATHRVRILSPSTTCAATVTPAAPVATTTGGLLAIAIQTGPACSWVVESLPAWITIPGDPFGAGPGSVNLVVAANTSAPRTATILIGGKSVVVAQAGAMTIAGQVTISPSKPLPGVTITLSGAKTATATTDSGGNFSFSGFTSNGTYTVTPTLTGYTFVPASQTFTNAATNPAANFTAWPTPVVSGAGPVFGSTLQPPPSGFAARETISIYGSNLCADVPNAIPTLPDRLGNCFVQVDGVNLRIYYASAVQINAVLPQTLALGPHALIVQRYTDTTYKQIGSQSQPFSFTATRVAMGFAERRDGASTVVLAQYADGGLVGASRPVHAGDVITLYLTGLGRASQTFTEGAAPKAASSAVEPLQVSIQGMAGQLLYDGVQPEFPGIDQINLRLPAYTLPDGQNFITLQFTAPSASQTVTYNLIAN